MKLNLASERDDLSDSLEHAENALDTKKESVDYDNKINLYNGLIESDPTNASIHQLSIDNLNKEIENEQSTYTKANNSIETFDDEYPWTVSIDTATDEYNQTMIDRWTPKQQMIWAKNAVEKLQKEYTKSLNPDWTCWAVCLVKKAELENAKDIHDGKNEAYLKTDEAKSDISTKAFTIKVNDISPGMDVQWKTTSESINYALWTIIQKMMIALWSLSIFIMTIWGWYMVLHHWQDELLSKWKNIFMSWIYALVVALSSYYIIAIVRFILYN